MGGWVSDTGKGNQKGKKKKSFCHLPVLECHLLFYWTFWGDLKIGLPFPVKTSHFKNIKLFLYIKKYTKKIYMSSNPRLTQSYIMMCLFMRSVCLLKWEKKIQWQRQMSQSAYTGVFSAFLFWFLCIFTVTVCFLDLKKRELHWERHTHINWWAFEKQKKLIWLNRLWRLLFLSLPEDSSHQPSFLLNKNRRINVQLTKQKQKWKYCSLRIQRSWILLWWSC